jgi:pimeloyl-ACP methyl ester carboxylesterase
MSSERSLPIVLVHGGAHGAWCWAPTQRHLASRAIAIDLPPKAVRGVSSAGPGERPSDLHSIGVREFADSALADIDAAGLERFVLVGHSMGGLTLGEVARRVPHRVAHLVFISCLIPPEGGSIIDALPESVREMTRESVRRALAGETEAAPFLDRELARFMFCNDMDEEQESFVLTRIGLEAMAAFSVPASRAGIPPDLPKTYLRLRRDQALPPEVQDAQIAALRHSPGGEVRIVELDSGHNVMVSRPRELARFLDGVASAAA